jgi:acetylornithine deacetylase/succinyl-diaminopimelate desuccinylase-like protein
VEAEPERFTADLMIIADMGNIEAGKPVLTTALRGDVHCTVEVRTIETALHSGLIGGPAPDALVALIKLLGTLWDDRGNTVVPGLVSFAWDGADMPDDLYRRQSGMLPGVSIIGDGSVASKLWSKPNVTVTGLDAPSTDNAINILLPSAKAHLSMRIAPGQDPDAALTSLMEHLRSHAPWGVQVHVDPIVAAPAFRAPTDGPLFQVARDALGRAFGTPASEVGSGGSIPLLTTLQHAAPDAEFVLWGAEDVTLSRIHGSDESVDPTEIERLVAAEAMLLRDLGDASL